MVRSSPDMPWFVDGGHDRPAPGQPLRARGGVRQGAPATASERSCLAGGRAPSASSAATSKRRGRRVLQTILRRPPSTGGSVRRRRSTVSPVTIRAGGGEEQDHLGDVLRRAVALQGCALEGSAGIHLPAGVPAGLDVPRGDGVDPYLRREATASVSVNESTGRLRGAVGDGAAYGAYSGDRGDVDDTAPTGLLHVRPQRRGRERRAP
jgi:hypothetical protein